MSYLFRSSFDGRVGGYRNLMNGGLLCEIFTCMGNGLVP